MILNPWKIHWKMPDADNDRAFILCPYSKLYPLPCATKKDSVACRTCFFRQDAYNACGQYKTKTIRVCDRCGSQIIEPDRELYCIVRDRKGTYLADKELCLECSQELMDWLDGQDFPTTQLDVEEEALISQAVD